MKLNYRNTIDLIVREQAISIINGNLDLEGHNGPYYDRERKGRNYAHWIKTFEKYWINTNQDCYKEAIEKLSYYFLSNTDYSDAGVYYCRDKKNSDYVNGVIGQAWIIEGLISLARVLNKDEFYYKAVKIFKTLPFDKNVGMWERIEVDGKNIGFDITYNHQLWFAAAGAVIVDFRFDSEIDEMIHCFLTKSKRNFHILPSGLIYHFSVYYGTKVRFIKNKIKFYKHCIDVALKKQSLEYKEQGYHLFNMYGFAILYRNYSNHDFFKTKKFLMSLNYCKKDIFYDSLMNSDCNKDITKLKCDNIDKNINFYGFPYNSPAFECPYIFETFNINNEKILKKLWDYQIKNFFDKTTKKFSNNTEDVNVLNARIYELVNSKIFWR